MFIFWDPNCLRAPQAPHVNILNIISFLFLTHHSHDLAPFPSCPHVLSRLPQKRYNPNPPPAEMKIQNPISYLFRKSHSKHTLEYPQILWGRSSEFLNPGTTFQPTLMLLSVLELGHKKLHCFCISSMSYGLVGHSLWGYIPAAQNKYLQTKTHSLAQIPLSLTHHFVTIILVTCLTERLNSGNLRSFPLLLGTGFVYRWTTHMNIWEAVFYWNRLVVHLGKTCQLFFLQQFFRVSSPSLESHFPASETLTGIVRCFCQHEKYTD